jgi:phosphinothricin acetyltransferase
MIAADEMTDIAVREVRQSDLPAIQRIYAHHVLHGLGSFEEQPPDADALLARFTALWDRGLPALVAECRGEVRGYAYAGPFRPRSAYRHTVEDSVYVDPVVARCGVGRALLGALVARCTVLGFRQMVAVIGDSGNTASIRLHTALGFRHAGVINGVGFKRGRWVDVVLMQRALGEGDGSLPTGAGPPPERSA